MASDADLRAMAQSILDRNGRRPGDASASRQVSHGPSGRGTGKALQIQRNNSAVPLSHSQSLGQWDTWKRQLPKGQESAETSPYSTVVSGLRSKCPTAVDDTDWQQAIMDSDRFMEQWVDQAAALGWTARDLFGLAPVPDRASPNFRRLSRYDLTGLIWLLRGRPVVAVTENSAAIQGSSGAVTIYRKNSKPALGPLGDGLDDLEGAQFAGGAESDVT